MIAIRLVRSKLRKREDHGVNEAHTEPSVVQTATPISTQQTVVSVGHDVISTNNAELRCNNSINTATTTCSLNSVDVVNGIPEGNLAHANDNGDPFIWQFPPPYPPLTPPPQYTLYNDQVNIIFFSLIYLQFSKLLVAGLWRNDLQILGGENSWEKQNLKSILQS